jgi:hypothetical protein
VGAPRPPDDADTPPGADPAADGRAPARIGVVVAGCVAVSVVSLALPATLAFDPWAWLVWGREVVHLRLDTTGGPSWKPLPVLVAAPLTLAGGLAPTLWLVVARTAGLLAVVATYRLAARVAGPVAGLAAGGLLLLTPDGGPRFVRLVVEGHSAPVTAALCLWAVDRHLAGRHASTLVLITALALDRPEAWPFLGLYALWLWRREPARRALIVGCSAAVPLLWFGADWWGAGDAWHGADAAQVVSGGAADRIGLVWERVAKVVVTPAWVAAAIGLVSAWRRHERLPLVLGAAAGAWLVLVGAMSIALGYAALSRFLLPAAAALCVLAGVGVARLVAAAPRGAPRVACVALVAALSLPSVVIRTWSVGTVADGVAHRAYLEDELDVAVRDAGGPDELLACGRLAVDRSDVPRVAVAWKLDVPLHRVDRRWGDRPGVVFVRAGRAVDRELSAREPDAGAAVELARSDAWAVFAVGCA